MADGVAKAEIDVIDRDPRGLFSVGVGPLALTADTKIPTINAALNRLASRLVVPVVMLSFHALGGRQE